MSQSSSIPALQMGISEPQEHQEGKEYPWSDTDQTAATPHGEHWGTQGWKHGTLAPDSWGACEEWLQGAQTLASSHHRKVLNSLTWDTWFSLTPRNTLDIQTTCPLLQNFCITLNAPLASSEQLSQGCLSHLFLGDAVFQPWGSKNSHRIKHNSHVLHESCMYFFSQQFQLLSLRGMTL